MRTRSPLGRRLAVIVITAAAIGVLGAPAASLAVVADPDTLVATLSGADVPTDGDPDGSGQLSLNLDADTNQACFSLDVTLTDLVGDPPTSYDIRDAGDNVVLDLGTSVDAAGHAAGCLAAQPADITAMFSAPGNYTANVRTAGYPDGALLGYLNYSYATTNLSVRTRVCPASIQTLAALTESARATCLDRVLPGDAPTPPSGYTLVGFGGTATFDYHVTDGKHLDSRIADVGIEGGYTCSDVTMTCSVGGLPYMWQVGVGPLSVTPTLPAGTRFALATATDATDDSVAFPVTVGAGNELTFDAATENGAALNVFLFQAADSTAPVIDTPRVGFRGSGTFGPTAPIRLTWTASDAGSGLARFVVQRSIDGAAYTTLASSVQAKAFDTTITAGHDYRFRVRAYDGAGNSKVSPASAHQRLRVVQDGASAVRYAGTWTRVGSSTASGGTVRYSKTAGSTVRLTFSGRSIAWVAPVNLGRGSASVSIDGGTAKVYSLYGPSAPRQVVFAARFSSVGTHTIRIRVLGTSGHPRVDLDAFLVLN